MPSTEPNSRPKDPLAQELFREEFIQNCLQYRWLDETRSKLIDRFFIIVLAVIGARLQFREALDKLPIWLFVLHVILIGSTFLIAFSIVRYRRQQRGHSTYLKKVREMILKEYPNLCEYGHYIKGKPVYLTLGIEMLVVLLSFLAPCGLIIDQDRLQTMLWSCTAYNSLSILAIIIVFLLNTYWIVIPFLRYNFTKNLDWEK